MNYLLDTNVLSEMQKANCDKKVRAFVDAIPQENLYICTVSIGEICFGIEKLPPGKKKHEHSLWLYSRLPEWFAGRVVDLETEVLLEWGKVRAQTGRTIPVIDAFIAAAAIAHHLTILTRNVRDFEGIEEVSVVNPWETPAL